jgi:GntR family transcriptional regulator
MSPIFHSRADSNSPLYLQVEATLKEMIEGWSFSPGEQIPSERELSEQLGVSRMTVRRAIENLISHGLLERRSTSGTYVRPPQVLRHVGEDMAVGLTQMLREEGAVAGSVLLSFKIELAPLKIAEKLRMRVGAPVVVVRRLRTVNEEPFCVETSYLPKEIVPNLTAEDLVSSEASLYRLMQHRYGVRFKLTDEILKISFATQEEAGLLGLKHGAPILLLRSVVSDANDRPVEYLKSVNHPDRVAFHSISTPNN